MKCQGKQKNYTLKLYKLLDCFASSNKVKHQMYDGDNHKRPNNRNLSGIQVRDRIYRILNEESIWNLRLGMAKDGVMWIMEFWRIFIG